MIVDVSLPQNPYKVFINEIEHLDFSDKKVAIITNPKVAGLHLNSILTKIKAKEVFIITIPDGEEYKNFETVQFILDRLFDHRVDRKSLLIAFGGGVIGDITGFCASIFQRGIDFIQIPTTLLSQVDASVGGKTGVNNKFGKNLVGSFYQPKAVYIDPHFLSTLPKREFKAGVAEIIKMAVIFDKDFFEWLKEKDLKDINNLKLAIKKCVEIKTKVVIEDEKESGIRAALNYGHTFCHVIENLTNYSTYLHGEAVAIGICMANRLAKKLGLINLIEFEEIKNLLLKYDLPIEFEVKDRDDFYNHFFLDKKSQNSKIKFVLPNGIGNFLIKDDIKKEDVISIL